jgi:hypothetical protein
VDGIKTGHTAAAGYCLVASASRDGQRLISVVMGNTSENQRAVDSQALLNWGFRFFESHRLYEPGKPLATPKLWKGAADQVAVGVFGDDYDDLVIPGTAINPTGAAGAATLNQNTGLLEFSGTADQVCTFSWQLPHGWSGAYQDDEGMAIVVPHLHVRFLTATETNSRWKFEWDPEGVTKDFTNDYEAWTTLSTVTKANSNNAKRHTIVSFGNLDLPGKTISTIVHGRVTRLASSDAADNYTGLVALYSADLHIRRRRWGTEAEYT